MGIDGKYREVVGGTRGSGESGKTVQITGTTSMQQFKLSPASINFLITTCAGLLALSLYILYQDPLFGIGLEGWPQAISKKETMFITGLVFASALLCWLGLNVASPILNQLVAPIRRSPLYALVILAILAFAAFTLIAGLILEGFPNSGDEQALVLQAQTYAQGHLWTEPPPLVEAFRMEHYFDVHDKWVSRYTPGWALIAAPVAALGLPLWFVNPLIGAATLIAFFYLACVYVSKESAWIGALLLGASSFFILNSASYFSHILTTLYGVLFAIFASRYAANGSSWYAVLAGACIGLMGLTRTANSLIFVIPFVASLAMSPPRGLVSFGLGWAAHLSSLR